MSFGTCGFVFCIFGFFCGFDIYFLHFILLFLLILLLFVDLAGRPSPSFILSLLFSADL